jgi:hypothetical protein
MLNIDTTEKEKSWFFKGEEYSDDNKHVSVEVHDNEGAISNGGISLLDKNAFLQSLTSSAYNINNIMNENNRRSSNVEFYVPNITSVLFSSLSQSLVPPYGSALLHRSFESGFSFVGNENNMKVERDIMDSKDDYCYLFTFGCRTYILINKKTTTTTINAAVCMAAKFAVDRFLLFLNHEDVMDLMKKNRKRDKMYMRGINMEKMRKIGLGEKDVMVENSEVDLVEDIVNEADGFYDDFEESDNTYSEMVLENELSEDSEEEDEEEDSDTKIESSSTKSRKK